MKRTILISILIALCFYIYGCGDEGIELTLQEIGAAPSAQEWFDLINLGEVESREY